MAKKKRARPKRNRTEELLEMLIVFQLHAQGVGQTQIGKAVGRQRAWVTKLVRGLPKGGR